MTMSVDDIVDILENHLFVLVDGPDHNLVESGDLDSFRFVELLLAVEAQTGQQIPADDLDLDDLQTPSRIAKAFNDVILRSER